MMSLDTFRQSLAEPAPPVDATLPVKALWWAGKGNWDQAHQHAQQLEGDPACDLVHAYLHRVEGDISNAHYWYRRVGREMPTIALADEWTEIAEEILTHG